ncbi:hypothetical protein CCUS01_03035 [Colletotrichum cuscutae]|uniref:Uncharacterized protein n=1 Tax=Colletotrichum cuscutae TaxID=1209917 RepID=A0AAI9YAW2_9PEZI|nr:hypothetical protein CCUS01_03035 [Colletotrichum cuscutae]
MTPIANSLKKLPSSTRTLLKMAQYCLHHEPPCVISPIHGGCTDISSRRIDQDRNIRGHSSGYTVEQLSPDTAGRDIDADSLTRYYSNPFRSNKHRSRDLGEIDEHQHWRRPRLQLRQSSSTLSMESKETTSRGPQRQLEHRERGPDTIEESTASGKLTRRSAQALETYGMFVANEGGYSRKGKGKIPSYQQEENPKVHRKRSGKSGSPMVRSPSNLRHEILLISFNEDEGKQSRPGNLNAYVEDAVDSDAKSRII